MNTGINALRPVVTHPVVDRAGLITRPWADYLARLASIQSSDDMRQLLEALAKRVAELEDGGGVSVVGRKSVRSTGSSIIYIQLAGDEDAPGPTEYYGTGPDGAKGFFPVADAIAVRADELEKLVGPDGVITLGLADLTDAGGGTLKKIVRDNKGRVSGTSDPTTDDLPEGVTNLYYTDERAAAAAPVQSVNDQTGDVVLEAADVGAQPASANLTAWAGIAPATKADDSAVVHKAGAEEVTGSKTFTNALKVQVGTPAPGMLVGADVFGTTVTPNVRKLFRMALPSFDPNVTLPMLVLSADTNGTDSATLVSFGGQSGVSGVSAATALYFVTANSYGEVGGVTRWGINSIGLFPYSDNTYDLGGPSNRPKQLWAVNGTINTSDAREKTPVRALAAAEIAAARDLGNEIGVYQWLAMIQSKGEDGARLHVGMTVQRAIEIMESHGLDPMRYGFICYDEWPERPEIIHEWPAKPQVVDDFGNLVSEAVEAGSEIVQEHRSAGNRYSFRMDELLAFIARGFAHRLNSIEQRLAAAGL